MADLTNTKVGDKLLVTSGYYDKGRIVTVDRITPTGRVITAVGEFNPNGRKRGDRGWYTPWARPATEDDIAGVYRYGLVQKLTNFRKWEALSAEDLKIVAAIIAKHQTVNP